jgi:hypothetical protein
MPELRLQRYVGNGAVAEHPVTEVAPAGEKMPAAAVSGKACAVSAATMPAYSEFATTVSAASVFATMPTASVFATMPAASVFATMPTASVFATMPTASVFATMPAAAVSATVSAAAVSATTVSAATALRVCFECEKRHDEEQHRGQASAGRQHQPHNAVGLRAAPHRCGRLSLGILPRTKSF